MIKGVNHRVVEVVDTQNEYFERIIFFVKPECVSVSEGRLRERANAIAGKADKPPMTRIIHNRIAYAVSIAVAAGAGAGLTAFITAVFR